jgi:hypothetical protein
VVMLGIDVHKATHTAVAVDDVGRKIGQRMVSAGCGSIGHGSPPAAIKAPVGGCYPLAGAVLVGPPLPYLLAGLVVGAWRNSTTSPSCMT